MTNSTLARVNYYDQQFLRLADLVDEQAYHIAMHRRHNLAAHTWGIAYGLELAFDPDKNPVVNPGLAIDGYGREIILLDTTPLDLDAFDQKNSDSLDLYLVYSQQEIDALKKVLTGAR
jgi:hypothetical protein